MGRDVIDDDVVVDVVIEVACHQEAQPATIIISKIVLDEISVDIHRASSWGKQVWVSREFASDKDTATFIV